MKKCPGCGSDGPFYKNKAKPDGLSSSCCACSKAAHTAWKQANTEKAKKSTKNWREKNPDRVKTVKAKWREDNDDKVRETARRNGLKRYGITVEMFEELYDLQKGICPICEVPMKKTGRGHLSACVDHETGVVRGLLHQKCNAGLGHFRDDPWLLRRAAGYLERFVAVLLVVSFTSMSARAEGDVVSVPPGDDVILPVVKGQPSPISGQVFSPETALRWANWLKQYQLVLKLNHEYDTKICKANTDFLQTNLDQERARYKVVSEDYQKRLAAAQDENNQLRLQLASPPWYNTVWFGVGLGVLTTSVAVGMGIYAAK
jgi:hypothetical protein